MQVPVEEWKYKDGVADESRHTGPYAEDMNKQFGNGVAPGGKGLDIISVSGTHHAAIQELGKEVKAIKAQIGLEPIPLGHSRSAERRVGKGGVSTGRSSGSPDN